MNKTSIFITFIFCISCTTKTDKINSVKPLYDNYLDTLNFKEPYNKDNIDSMKVRTIVKNHWYKPFIYNNDTINIREYYEEKRLLNGQMDPDRNLKLSAFNKKDVNSMLKWELSYNEKLISINKDYFKTFKKGCCGSEEGYSLFSTENGKIIFKYTKIDSIESPFKAYISYHSRQTMNYDVQDENEKISGNIIFYNINGKIEKYIVERNPVKVPLFNFSPDSTQIISNDMIKQNHFEQFFIYLNGQIFENQVIDNFYYMITVDSKYIFVAISENGLMNESIISNSKEYSENFKLIKTND